MFSVYIMCLCLLPLLAEIKRLSYFIYCIIKMSESIHNNAKIPTGHDMDQDQLLGAQTSCNVPTNPGLGS